MSISTSPIRDIKLVERVLPSISETKTRMQVDRVQLAIGSELSNELILTWRDIQASNPQLASPYFSFEFFQAASRSRPDAEVAILYAENKPVGFFPFHRISASHGIPIGGAINDYQGIIGLANLEIDAAWLVQQCGLTRWDFHSLWWPKAPFLPYCFQSQIPASSARLGEDHRAYLQHLCDQSTTIARQPQKTRKMQREVGALNFTLDDRNPEVLEWIIRQKRSKYKRTGCTDFFAPHWTRMLLAELGRCQQHQFQGMCSVLRAGDSIVAAHFGMLANGILHYWYPVFDRDYHQYSPGTELYLQIVQAAASRGIRQIDMGYGTENFKTKIVNQWGHLASGSVDLNRTRFWWNRWVSQTADCLKKSRWRSTVKHLGRILIPTLGKPKVQ